MSRHDLVVRGGFVVDGSGEPGREADIAIDAGKITKVGTVSEAGVEEIDARGKLVAPGFVDIHTHYDGQVTWGRRSSRWRAGIWSVEPWPAERTVAMDSRCAQAARTRSAGSSICRSAGPPCMI